MKSLHLAVCYGIFFPPPSSTPTSGSFLLSNMMATHEEAASLHVCSLPDSSLFAAAYETMLLVGRVAENGPGSGTGTRLQGMHAFRDVSKQRIRCIALFVHRTSGCVVLVTGGDAKLLRVYAVNVGADQTVTCTPVFTCGPHNKKIVSVCGSGEQIVFADKFGEVYRVDLLFNKETNRYYATEHSSNEGDGSGSSDDDDGDKKDDVTSSGSTTLAASSAAAIDASKAAATFVLQHFSLVLHCLLSSPDSDLQHNNNTGRHIITCDREAHVRVSRFPQTFVIDQYLWTQSPQAAVTAAALVTPKSCEANVFITGDRRGRVSFWNRCLSEAGSAGSSYRLVRTVDLAALCGGYPAGPTTETNAYTGGGVLGLAYLSTATTDAHGVVVALDQVASLFFIPLRIGGFGVDVCDGCVTRLEVEAGSPVALVSCSISTALYVSRDCGIVVATLECDAVGESSRLTSTASNTSFAPVAVALRENITCLTDLDLFAHWRPVQAKDPRISKQAAAEGDEESTRKKPKGENVSRISECDVSENSTSESSVQQRN